MSLYNIIFEDNSTYVGGTYQDTKWLQIPSDKKIKGIIYHYAFGRSLVLKDFKRIYHYIEATKDFYGNKSGKVNLEYVHLLIEQYDKIIHYKIDLKINKMSTEIMELNDKYIISLNPIGWRTGIIN